MCWVRYISFMMVLSISFLVSGNKWLQVEKNLKHSIQLENYGSFIKAINKCRCSKLTYLPSGQTPLTLVINNIGSSKGSFFCVILTLMKYCIVQPPPSLVANPCLCSIEKG